MSWPNRTLSHLEVKSSLLIALAGLVLFYALLLGWVHGLLATALVAFSVLLHELGHVLVATVNGVKVKRIGFAAAGGYTVREPSRRWWVEAESALAGPLVNLLLFLIFNSAQGVVAHAAAQANLVLAIGNLIPISRSDGSRLWKAISSRETAAGASAPIQAATQVVESAGVGGKISTNT